MRKLLALSCLLLGSIIFSKAQTLKGKVISVKDGDTIEILINNVPYRIRLASIDCPEKKQAYGTQAKKFTSKKCFNKEVTVQQTDVDKYGRIVGFVILKNGENLNQSILENGFGWHYLKYSKDPHLSELEAVARSKKRGLWKDKMPVAPWDFRKHKS